MLLPYKKIAIWLLQVGTVVLIGIYFIDMYRSASALKISFSYDNIQSLFLSIGFISLGFSLLSVPTLVLLRAVGKKVGFIGSMRIFFFSQIGKYVPGKVWVAVGRVLMYTKMGVGRGSAIFILGLELVFMIGIALMFPGRMIAHHMSLQPGLWAILLCCVLIPLFLIARKRRITASKIREYVTIFAVPMIIVCISFILFWVFLGLAFQHLILYFTRIDIGSFPAMQIFSASWAAGFLAFFMPVGLGVREVFMSELLAPLIGNENALMIAIVSRIWWTIIESLFIVISSGKMISGFLKTNALPEIS
jgi:glycosyltransferase 2 family protein